MEVLETCMIVNVAPGSLVEIPGTDAKLRVLVDRGQVPKLAEDNFLTVLCVEEQHWELRRIDHNVPVHVIEKADL